VVFGTFVLWVGWYGFNCGSTLSMASGGTSSTLASKVAATTTLSAAAGGIGSCFLWNYYGETWSVERTSNGILGGLVGITAGCSVVEPWAAIVIGFVSAAVYTASSKFVKDYLEVDDVIDASPVHLFCGMWGCLAVGFFATEDNLKASGFALETEQGIFYGGGGKRLGVAVLGILCIGAWVSATMYPFFWLLNKQGMYRVSASAEEKGVDLAEMGGSGYDFTSKPPASPVPMAGATRTLGDEKKTAIPVDVLDATLAAKGTA
jgi:ammonium transporter, Amt family